MATLQPQIFGIFHIIGISIILIDLLHRFNLSLRGFLICLISILLLTLVVNMLSPLTDPEYFFSITTPHAYTRPDLISYSSDNLFVKFLENVVFARISYPILPWASFTILGYILAKYLLSEDEGDKRTIVSLGVGMILVVLSLVMMVLGIPIYKYPTTLNYVILSSGVFIVFTATVKGMYDARSSTGRNLVAAAVESTGQSAFEIFILQHYLIAAGALFFALELLPLVLVMIGSSFFLLIAVSIANLYGNRLLTKLRFYRLTGALRPYSFILTMLSIILLSGIFIFQTELQSATRNVVFYLITRGSSFVSILLVYWQVMLVRRAPSHTTTENLST